MDFALTDQQEAIRDAIAKICEGFDDAYWLKKDREGGFPHDFHKALADAGLADERIWGERIEDRGSQITFSGLGQAAPNPVLSVIKHFGHEIE